MSGLRDLDLDGVRDAVSLLREGGFRVREVTDLSQADHGVEFDLTLYADTRSKTLNPAVESFLQGIADTYKEAFSALFASEGGASVVVTLYEGVDPDEWADLALRDSSVKRVEVVEAVIDRLPSRIEAFGNLDARPSSLVVESLQHLGAGEFLGEGELANPQLL